LGDLVLNGRIVKWTLKKQDKGMKWIYLAQERVSAGSCEHGNEPFFFIQVNFLTGGGNVSISIMTLLYVVS